MSIERLIRCYSSNNNEFIGEVKLEGLDIEEVKTTLSLDYEDDVSLYFSYPLDTQQAKVYFEERYSLSFSEEYDYFLECDSVRS